MKHASDVLHLLIITVFNYCIKSTLTELYFSTKSSYHHDHQLMITTCSLKYTILFVLSKHN
jgi:hypothetical protein